MMKYSDIEDFLEEKLAEKNKTDLEKTMEHELTEEFKKIGSDSEKLLKWNNPIRSYSAIMTQRLLQDYSWVFNGKLSPFDVLLYSKDIKRVK